MKLCPPWHRWYPVTLVWTAFSLTSVVTLFLLQLSGEL